MANEMRDRLVELFKKIEYTPYLGSQSISNLALQFTDYALYSICDDLIENGVVVPPCKVGDTVYYPWIYDGQCGIAFSEVESIKIYVNGLPIVVVEDWKSDIPMPICFTIDDFGKTVFLTKAEAEQKLKEMRGRNDL